MIRAEDFDAERGTLVGTPDANADALLKAIPGSETRETARYRVEYGIRYDDGAGVAHFYAPEPFKIWDARFPAILEAAVGEVLDTTKVTLAFTPELYSFFLVTSLTETHEEPWIASLLEVLDARLESGMGSGT